MSTTPQTISALIPKYIEIVNSEEENSELYKWEAIKHFHDNWDIETDDFESMFAEAFKKKENLIYHNSFGFLNKLSQNFPEELRSLFRNLFDESKGLPERIQEHQEKSDELLEKLKSEIERTNISHQQDERTISFLLVLKFPEKHFLYKSNVYEAYCKHIGAKPKKAGEKLFHFEELCEEAKNEVANNSNFQNFDFYKQVQKDFNFDPLNLIIQDIIYRTLIVEDEEVKPDELRLLETLKTIGYSDSKRFYTFIKTLLTNLSIEEGNDKICYSLTKKQVIGITIGQKYCTIVEQKKGENSFKYFDTSENDKNWLKEADSMEEVENSLDIIQLSAENELAKTNKTGYKEHSSPSFEKSLFDNNYRNFIFEKAFNMKFTTNSEHSLNQILFGPPGTGKTYFTKNTALEIIGLDPENMDRETIQREFNQGLKDGRIVFTTFHQSMSYEDFIEGIKPIINEQEDSEDENNTEEVKYEIVDGIFKEACENAKVLKEFSDTDSPKYYIPEEVFEGKKFFKLSLGNTLKDTGDIVYDFCKENNYIATGWGSNIDYTGVKSRKDILSRLTETGIQVGKMDFNISAIERFTLWMRKGDIVFASHGNRQLKAVGVITGEYEFKSSEETPIPGYNHFRKVEWKILDAKIPVGKVYEKNFSQQSIYELYTKNVKPEFFTKSTPSDTSINDNYVIIIDEINRGNVSQIFGELITLIEEDKRSGKDEALEVTLPYSKKSFSVPPNLFIIGTMNTADRSVEALDTALRRRFSFQEMMPNPKLLTDIQIEGINLAQLLTTINERIEVLVDRDHTIGHSYFLNVKTKEDLKNVFKDKVIPLLQEYFFGDYSKMELVIGSYFFKKELPKVTFAVNNHEYYEERKRYVFKDFDGSDFDIITALKALLLITEEAS